MSKRLIALALLTVLVALAFLPGLVQADPLADPVFTWGDGADGDLTIPAGGTYNINANNHPGRTCGNGGDGVSYEVIGLTARTATLRNSPSGGCLNVGDEFILINLQGSAGTTGNNELLRVQNISANLVTFSTNKTKFYGANNGDDSGLGISQRVVLQRVPNYNNLTLNGNLIANAWNGTQYGLVVFKVKGNWIGSGTINLIALGYRGGKMGTGGAYQGESWPGPGIIAEFPNGGGGAGRNHGHTGCPAGQGNYAGGTVDQVCTTPNGLIYGAAPLNQLYPGSGGGGRADSNGGTGGGIVYIMSNNTNFLGAITVQGQDGDGTGAGSGGSIRIEGTKLSLGVLNAMGGKGMNGASSGVGRIAIYYVNSWSSSSASPAPYAAQVAAVPTASPTKTQTRTPNFAATSTSIALTLTAKPTLSKTPNLNASATALSWTRTAQVWTKTPNLPLTLTAIWYNATGTAQAQTSTAQASTPDYNATATALAGTPDYNKTATSLAQTATALAASSTPDYNETATSLAQTATAEAATSTPDFFASATAMWLTATARAATPTPSPDFNATGTTLAETATAQAATSTPDFFASATAMWLTATARAASPTPDLNATATAQSMTATAQAATSTPDFNATGTAQAQITPTASVNNTAVPTAGSGSGNNFNNALNDTPTPSASGSSFGASCNITLNVYVYVDSNLDGMMAAQGEGVNSLQVNFLDASFGKVGSAYATNGKATFCVPDYLKGLTLRVDIPYLQRTGTMQAPDDNNKNQPLEMWFRLEPPTLPLFIP